MQILSVSIHAVIQIVIVAFCIRIRTYVSRQALLILILGVGLLLSHAFANATKSGISALVAVSGDAVQ